MEEDNGANAGFPGSAEAAQPPAPAEVKSPTDQLVEAMRAAGDTMSLMGVVTQAEGSGHFNYNKDVLFTYAHENALRLQDREAALMYGNRTAAEVMGKAVKSMHDAVVGMVDSAGRHGAAADTMMQAADMNRQTSYRG
jgi:hypothetical protein